MRFAEGNSRNKTRNVVIAFVLLIAVYLVYISFGKEPFELERPESQSSINDNNNVDQHPLSERLNKLPEEFTDTNNNADNSEDYDDDDYPKDEDEKNLKGEKDENKKIETNKNFVITDEYMIANPFTNVPVPMNLRNISLDDSAIWFLHIPKTGGMSLNDELRRIFRETGQVGSNVRCSRRWDVHFAGSVRMFQIFSDYSYFRGNFSGCAYGVGHTDITVEKAVLPRKMYTVTMLREPKARVESLFYFIRSYIHRDSRMINRSNIQTGVDMPPNRPIIPPPVLGREGLLPRAPIPPEFDRMKGLQDLGIGVVGAYKGFNISTTFLEFFSSQLPTAGADNYMVRAFSGTLKSFVTAKKGDRSIESYNPRVHNNTMLIKENPKIVKQIVQAAKEYLWNVPFFGLTENFEDSLALFAWSTNLPLPPTRIKRNVTPPHSRNITDSDLSKLAEIEQYDSELYDFSVKLFNARCDYMKKWYADHDLALPTAQRQEAPPARQ